MCEKADPKYKCLDCRMPLCDECKSMHLKIPMLRGHNIEALTEEHASECIDDVMFCTQHPDKVLELSCKTCRSLICLVCALKDHRLHDTETIKEASDASLPSIAVCNVKVNERMKILEAQVKVVMKTVEETREMFATKRIELDEHLEKVKFVYILSVI